MTRFDGPPPETRETARCRGCGERIEEDEEARLLPTGALVHRRCGGQRASLSRFVDDQGE